MTTFWIIAVAMAAVAMGFALWPLYRGRSEDRAARIRAHSNLAIFEDRLAELDADLEEGRVTADEHEVLRTELERSLLGDIGDLAELDAAAADAAARSGGDGKARGAAALLTGAVALPLLALFLYADWGLSLGFQDELALARDMRAVEQLPMDGHDQRQVSQLIERLQQRLQAQPDDADGWFLLGRTRLNQGEFEAAAEAFGRVAELMPGESVPLVFKVQALYLAEDRQLPPRVRQVLDRVLEMVPDQPIMLEILAMDAFQNGRFAEAANLFGQVLASGVPEGDRRRFLEDGLARSQELAGLPPTLPLAPSVERDASAAAAGIRVNVSIADDVLAGLPDTAAVFVMARPVGGPPMPLAVQRVRPASRMQVDLDLDDAMTPEAALDSVDEVEVVARLSRAGTAERGAGDLERSYGPVATRGAGTVQLQLGAAPAGAAPVPEATPALTGSNGVRALVELSPDLSLPEGATLYVFAREVGGPPAPLAVARHDAGELPLLVTLDDAMAMTPERPLSGAAQVQIVARVSADGGVVANPGDLEGVSAPLDPRRSNRVVNVLIDRRID